MGQIENSPKSIQFSRIVDSRAARITGLIADVFGAAGGIIGVTTFLLAARLSPNSIDTEFFGRLLTPLHALGLWLVTVYIYLSILRTIWARWKRSHELSERFRDFFFIDLIYQFRFPWLLLPVVALVVLFIWILIEVLIWQGNFVMVILGLIFMSIYVFALQFANMPAEYRHELKVRSFKKDVVSNWDQWESRIKTELKPKDVDYISVHKLKDLAEVWDVKNSDMSYVFARYAAMNSKQVKYGDVYCTEDEEYAFTNILAKRSTEWPDGYKFL